MGERLALPYEIYRFSPPTGSSISSKINLTPSWQERLLIVHQLTMQMHHQAYVYAIVMPKMISVNALCCHKKEICCVSPSISKIRLNASLLECLLQDTSICRGSTAPSCDKAIIMPRMVWVNALRCPKKYIVFHISLPSSFPQNHPCCIVAGKSARSYNYIPWKYTIILC